MNPPNGLPWCKVGMHEKTMLYDDCNMDNCEGRLQQLINLSQMFIRFFIKLNVSVKMAYHVNFHLNTRAKPL